MDLKAVGCDNTADCSCLYSAALLAANYGQQDNYRLICGNMVKRFGDSQDPNELHLVVCSCVLAPRAVDDMQPVLDMAERLMSQAPSDWRGLQTTGAAFYRVWEI